MRRLVLLPEEGLETSLGFPLREGTYLIGRSQGCDILIGDRSVSRRHARLTLTGADVQLFDLGSVNGTFVGGFRVDRTQISAGQCVRFGQAPFRLVWRLSDVASEPCEDEATDRRPSRCLAKEISGLTPAQRRVHALLLEGLSELQIARQLNVSANTVHTHVKAVYRQLDVNTRAQLLSRTITTIQQLTRSPGDSFPPM